MNKTNKVYKSKEGLEKLLKTRENQYTMLKNTLDQLMGGDMKSILGSKDRIRVIQNEIDNTINEIDLITQDLNDILFREANEGVEYSFYDRVKKGESFEASEGVNDAFYDSVVRQPRIAKVIGECGKNCVCGGLDGDAVCGNKKESNYLNEINENADGLVHARRFMVNIEDALEIPNIMVKSICFAPDKSLFLTVYDFVKTFSSSGKKYSLMELLTLSMDGRFSLTIDHLDANGKVLYKEAYKGCRIREVNRSCLDYSSSDISTVNVTIPYDEVKYEASQQ